MSQSINYNSSTIVEKNNIKIFRCGCGKEFDVTGYPVGYKFECPKCHAFCVIKGDYDDLEHGLTLADFIIDKRIGRGGMGVVYLGTQLSLGRPVAIKALKKDIASNEDFIHRFTQEAQTAAQIIHNNIVQVYYVGEEKSTFFIAMEYVDGRTVRELINESKGIPEPRALEIILQTASGLQRAHEMNIMHRDIKPDNLIINLQGEVKVADFGLALDLGESKKSEGPRQLEGSPHYMSPEQATRGEISFSSDIYSLGASLYHMVTSVPPFTGKSPAAIIAKHITDYPRSPKEIKLELSKGLCQIIQKMMAKKPEDRFSSMAELIDQLDSLKSGHARGPGANDTHWFMEERDDSTRLRDLMAIFEVNKVIGQERDLNSLLLRVVQEITSAMNSERSTLYIYDPDRKEIWAKVAEGMEGKVIHLPVGKGIAGTVAQELRTEVINDPYRDPRFNKEVDKKSGFSTRNMICMPVLGSDVELLGVIQVLNKRTGDFDNYDESMLSALAVHVGLTLEKSRYFCALRPKCKKARS